MQKRQGVFKKLALLLAALIWGSSFFVVKNTVDVFPPTRLLAIRFTIGAALLGIIFCRKLRKIDRGYIRSGAIIGVLLFGGYFAQTIGITDTTPGKNAFLTAIYCVIVPFLFWIVARRRPDRYNFLAAVLCIAGIGLVSLQGDFSISMGDGLTMVGGLFFAGHMVAVAKVTEGRDPVLLTIMQFAVAALLSWAVGFATEKMPAEVSLESWGGLLFLAVFATAGGLLLQNIGQKGTNPAAASILLSLESVFGVLFSVLFYGEQLTARLVIGFAVIFVAVVISETKLSFLRRKPAAPRER